MLRRARGAPRTNDRPLPERRERADGQAVACSSNCGSSSVISNHGAFEPTKMCFVGRIEGASTSDPSATCTYSPSRTTEKRSEPQAAHLVSLRVSSPTSRSPSPPCVSSRCSRSIPANGLNAEPVALRQREQWQFDAYLNSSATRYRTAPHSQLPSSIATPSVTCSGTGLRDRYHTHANPRRDAPAARRLPARLRLADGRAGSEPHGPGPGRA